MHERCQMKRKFTVLDQQLEQCIKSDDGITIQRVSLCVEHVSGPEINFSGSFVMCEEVVEEE